MRNLENLKIVSGNANKELAEKIAKELNIKLCDATIETFSDGEINVEITESIRGADVFLIEPLSPNVNFHLMELLILIDAAKRASAGRITAVIPYFGYARQDRKDRPRKPITAKLVADLLEAAGANRILTIDLHASQIEGFFNIPVDHVTAIPLIRKYVEKNINLENIVVVSPDVGSAKKSRKLSSALCLPLAIIDKQRTGNNKCEVLNLIGDVTNKDVIILDDLVDTAGTVANAVDAIKELGAKDVYLACTHPVFSGPAIERLKAAKLKQIITTNSIILPKEKQLKNIEVLDLAHCMSRAIQTIHENKSIGDLFKEETEGN